MGNDKGEEEESVINETLILTYKWGTMSKTCSLNREVEGLSKAGDVHFIKVRSVYFALEGCNEIARLLCLRMIMQDKLWNFNGKLVLYSF